MFSNVKIGDIVTRNFFGHLQRMRVTAVDEHLITAGMGWTFCRKTGWEEDPDIGYGVKFGHTCSHLVKGEVDGQQAQGTQSKTDSQGKVEGT